jgi:hypothetical protein
MPITLNYNLKERHLFAFPLLLAALAYLSKETIADDSNPIPVYTHGETAIAFQNPDGKITGIAIDRLTCTMGKLNQNFSLAIAPLSRARNIIQGSKPAIWLPAKFEGPDDLMAQMAGPAGALEVSWHMRKDNPLDPNSAQFQKEAKITTFSGSQLATWLKENNYNHMVGSADPNRLVYMLMSKEVDAVLSVELKNSVTKSIKKTLRDKIKHIPHKTIETAFRFSKGLIENQPAFVNRFRNTLQSCL